MPDITDVIAKFIPPNNIHKIFKILEPEDELKTTSFPNGQIIKPANLKHCLPIGIPIIVIHQNTPTRNQLTPNISPAKINHNILPNVLIITHPLIKYKKTTTLLDG